MEDVQRLIELAVRAGAFRAGARRLPEARETFIAAADLNSARVAALADRIAMAPTLLRRVDRT
jgi:hypothetical protein